MQFDFLSLGKFLISVLVALSICTLLFVLIRRVFQHTSLGRKVLDSVKWPLFAILLELSLFFIPRFVSLSEQYLSVMEHLLMVLVIATLGWLLAQLVRTLFMQFILKFKERTEDLHNRSTLTQLLFLYKLSMFACVLLTIGAILISFPYIKSIGIGILGSAGIAGIALGIAARPILTNLLAGFQIAFSKTLKLNDAIYVENELVRIESFHLTYIVGRTWDLRRLILPVSYFIDKPFQNWDSENPELIGTVFLYCDFGVSVEKIRHKVADLLAKTPLWNEKSWNLHVTKQTETGIEIRITVSADDSSNSFELCCYLREKLVEFLNQSPQDFPKTSVLLTQGSV